MKKIPFIVFIEDAIDHFPKNIFQNVYADIKGFSIRKSEVTHFKPINCAQNG